MKSRFNEEVDAILEGFGRAVFNAAAGTGLAALGILPAGEVIRGTSQAYQSGSSSPASSTPARTTGSTTTTPPAATSAAGGAVPLKNISNFDTKLKNIIDTSNLQPMDKTAIKSALMGLRTSSSRQLTTQDVANAIAALR